ncbi:DCP1A [Cordylochernes scorpioides]|uniref:DCP1A n=1 Tax=Cordylochernes scorpioides TaxID=51811 RepID=A0ABY6L2Q5_9ARAC|nr:DCP1A [Cordylochernes scorpioides]
MGENRNRRHTLCLPEEAIVRLSDELTQCHTSEAGCPSCTPVGHVSNRRLWGRSQAPQHGFIIMNRLNVNNLVESITPDLQLQQQSPFILYRKGPQGTINGIWFYDEEVCTRISQLFVKNTTEETLQQKNNNNVTAFVNGQSSPDVIKPRPVKNSPGVKFLLDLSNGNQELPTQDSGNFDEVIKKLKKLVPRGRKMSTCSECCDELIAIIKDLNYIYVVIEGGERKKTSQSSSFFTQSYQDIKLIELETFDNHHDWVSSAPQPVGVSEELLLPHQLSSSSSGDDEDPPFHLNQAQFRDAMVYCLQVQHHVQYRM